MFVKLVSGTLWRLLVAVSEQEQEPEQGQGKGLPKVVCWLWVDTRKHIYFRFSLMDPSRLTQSFESSTRDGARTVALRCDCRGIVVYAMFIVPEEGPPPAAAAPAFLRSIAWAES